jgi:restriction system protein
LHKQISAPDEFIVQSKLDALLAGWDEKFEAWQKKQQLVAGQESADDLTADALTALDGLAQILARTLHVDDRIDWEKLKDKTKYAMPSGFPEKAPYSAPPPKPAYASPKISFFDTLFGKKARLLAAAEQEFDAALQKWNDVELTRTQKLEKDTKVWKAREKKFWDGHVEKQKAFNAQQLESHAEVDRLKAAVHSGDEAAVIEHASLVLDRSDYDGLFEKSYLAIYDRSERLLKLAYDLPSMQVLPSTKQYRFIKSTGELRESFISEREKKANFESASYQICLRTLHELFEADVDGNIDKVLFNGFVTFTDPATGQEIRSCIMSVLTNRASFVAIDLSRVDPKACFKSLKGVSAASLASLAAIAPVMDIDTDDRRFIEAREIADNLDEGTNLAAITWDDFEHLVREVFDREFQSRGGEVKVTQSSSDGGVDAVAFDPDPITGGKIVIQAKRYTRTVGVSAVRDLYGTMMNEGASSGILVTTADFGPDAYKFATGKPLKLMTGKNLLHLMNKHGFNARIDLREARGLQKELQK